MNSKFKKTPTILLLEEDDTTRKLLVENLQKQGYRVIVVVNKKNIFDWISNTVQYPDVFLVNQVDNTIEEYIEFIQNLYRCGLSVDTPIVILAEQYDASLEGLEVKLNTNQYIIYLQDSQQLFDFIERICYKDR